ncbi:MAG: PHP domain-containing protein [Gammaproteobacteria bacterium]|nr:PHP domain-containing protein [Gammaproteobacteria bacterium]
MYDLHSHSTASDGSLTPTELVRLAHSKGVTNLALTDHDLIDGCSEAGIEAKKLGLNFINGAEISVSWSSQTIHIVGLNLDIQTPELLSGLQRLCEFRDWRAEEIARRLSKKRIEGAYEGAKVFAKGRIMGRTHFARFLLENGYAKDLKQVFKRFLVQGKPGYVPGQWASLEEALGWIQAAGGQAVIAHPARYRLSATRRRQLVGEFRELGGLALEVVSGSHSRDEILHMGQIANQFELHASAGSDYHGPENPYLDMGRLSPLPEVCKPIWEHASWPKPASDQGQTDSENSSLDPCPSALTL